jgi:hypothetical protein
LASYKGQDLTKLFQSKVINLDQTADHRFMTDELRELKEKYPELNDVPFVNAMSEDAYIPSDALEGGYEINGERGRQHGAPQHFPEPLYGEPHL